MEQQETIAMTNDVDERDGSKLGVQRFVIVRRPEHCSRSNEDLECLGCGQKLGVIGHRRRNGEPDYCPGEWMEVVT